MANLLDYIAWRGDLPIGADGFNEVDNLVLAELAYADFTGIVPGDFSRRGVTLSSVAQAYAEMGKVSNVINDPGPLLAVAGKSRRFGGLRLSGYRNEIDAKRQYQFCAEVFLLPDGTAYVAYRGTDNTVVGWREDFNFSYMQTEGQLQAAAYLKEAAAFFQCPLRAGGHSKGGNLAVYAAAFGGKDARLLNVYSNDGPGFNNDIAAMPEYGAALDRVTLIVPEFSIVGILMNNKSERRIVRSSASGVMQHNPLTWQVLGPAFEVVDSQSPAGIFMDETLQKWIGSLSVNDRTLMTNAIFDALDATGEATLDDIREHWRSALSAMLKAARQMEPERRGQIFDIMRRLSDAGRQTLMQDIKDALAAGQGRLKREDKEPLKEST